MNATPLFKKKTAYENNPFYIATNGLELLLGRALAIAITLALFSGIFLTQSLPSLLTQPAAEQPTATQSTSNTGSAEAISHALTQVPAGVWVVLMLIILIGIAVIAAFGIVLRGLMDYTSAQLAADKSVTLTEAFRAVFAHFWGYTWVLVIVTVKVLLWSLLLIIPGIIMAIRYSLAGVAYFSQDLKGDAAVQQSSRLVKGAWLTTFAAQNLLNLLTLGALKSVLGPGTNAVLYRQLSVTSEPKPAAHKLSWLTLIVPILVGFVALTFAASFITALANYLSVR